MYAAKHRTQDSLRQQATVERIFARPISSIIDGWKLESGELYLIVDLGDGSSTACTITPVF